MGVRKRAEGLTLLQTSEGKRILPDEVVLG